MTDAPLQMTPRVRPEETPHERLAKLEVRLDRIDKDLDALYLTHGDADEQYVGKDELKAEVRNIAAAWGWKAVWAVLGGGGLGALLWRLVK